MRKFKLNFSDLGLGTATCFGPPFRSLWRGQNSNIVKALPFMFTFGFSVNDKRQEMNTKQSSVLYLN